MTNPDLLRTDKGAGSKVTVGSPRTPPAASAPMLLAGCYRLEAPLGHGTASVFRARDLKTNLRYAIKRLPRDTALAAGEHDRFVSEVTLLSQLCHPHIVTMVALQRDEAERSCLVMELLEGEDMLTHLAGGQRLALPRVLAVTRQVTSALHAAHLRGIAHREFQLSSIFLAMQRGLCGTRQIRRPGHEDGRSDATVFVKSHVEAHHSLHVGRRDGSNPVFELGGLDISVYSDGLGLN